MGMSRNGPQKAKVVGTSDGYLIARCDLVATDLKKRRSLALHSDYRRRQATGRNGPRKAKVVGTSNRLPGRAWAFVATDLEKRRSLHAGTSSAGTVVRVATDLESEGRWHAYAGKT